MELQTTESRPRQATPLVMLAHELEITLEASFIALTRRPWTGPRPLDGAPRETPPGTGWTIIIINVGCAG